MVVPEQVALALGWPVTELSRRRVVEKAEELGLASSYPTLADLSVGYDEADAWRILAALRVEVAAAEAADARAMRGEQGLPADEPLGLGGRLGPFFRGFVSSRAEPGPEPEHWPAWPAAARELG